MADSPKILAALAPGASLTTLYTCPSATNTVARMTVCNRGTAAANYRYAASPLGAAINDAHYKAYGSSIGPGESIEWKGLCMQATDVTRVYGSSGDISFVLEGIEKT